MAPPPRGHGQIVGGVVLALKNQWSGEPFHRVVFDEASQISLPHAICGMLAGRRYVFVGDHRQLGPIVQGDHDDEIARLSIFEHLLGMAPDGKGDGDGRYPATMLETTYRMNDGINAFPSARFYRGLLRPAESCANRRFELRPGGPFDDLLDPDRPAVFASIAHEGHQMSCEPEARLVRDLLADLILRQGVSPEQVAVVTPYRAQIRLIENLVQGTFATTRHAGAGNRDALPVIDTVERMQGQQREIVIVSLVCSEPEYAAREAAFFFSPNRLNVSITRARTKLVVIASPLLFSALPADLEDLIRANRFVRLSGESGPTNKGGQ